MIPHINLNKPQIRITHSELEPSFTKRNIALRDATVNKCDVTCDIKSDIPVSELYDNLSFTNNQIYSLEHQFSCTIDN